VQAKRNGHLDPRERVFFGDRQKLGRDDIKKERRRSSKEAIDRKKKMKKCFMADNATNDKSIRIF